jgi:signal transduction histidine kinase
MADLDKQALRARVRKGAHDVRTPLTSIGGFAQLLLENGTLSSDARENLGIILEEAKRLSVMLDAFFDEVTETLDDE